MAQLNSMADQYALDQRQEEKIQEVLAKKQAQAEAAERKQNGTSAALINCPEKNMQPATYPVLERRRAESGTVIVRYTIDACGRVLQAEVGKGSGFQALDIAALTAVRAWVVGPPSSDSVSQPTDGWYETSINFLTR
jgi:TonB family protein